MPIFWFLKGTAIVYPHKLVMNIYHDIQAAEYGMLVSLTEFIDDLERLALFHGDEQT